MEKILISLHNLFKTNKNDLNTLSEYIDDIFLKKLYHRNLFDCNLIEYVDNCTFITSGAFSSIFNFNFKNNKKKIDVILRIVKFGNNSKYNSNTSPENVDWEIHSLLYILYDKNLFPFIIIPVQSFSCNSDTPIIFQFFLKYIKKNNNNSLYEKNKFYRFTMLEKINEGTLENFLKSYKLNDDHYFYILFNILLILTLLKKYLPGFRHNDLHTSNIFIKRTKLSSIKIGDIILNIGNRGYYLIINDFDYSEIRNQIINDKTECVLGSGYNSSEYYDLFKFLNTYNRDLISVGLSKNSVILQFINFITPENGNCLKKEYIYQKILIILFYQFFNTRHIIDNYFKNVNFKESEFYPDKLIKLNIFSRFYSNICENKN